MYLENSSFDAVITDKNGLTIEVDCRVTEPAASGLPAEISIEIPLSNEKKEVLENPCSLRGSDGGLEIEIKELWYRSIPAGITRRKHARGTFNINYAGQLWIRRTHWRSERGILRFLLSPVRFFKEHSKAEMVDYSSTPDMMVELFTLQTSELGEIRFIKFWSVHRVDTKGVAAEIRASFAAEIRYDEASPIEQLASKMREVLTPLSILTRQAITLHGWIWEKRDGIQTMWFDPLDPNLAPDMAEQPVMEVCFPQEFGAHAQAVVEKYLQASPNIKETITLLAVALAPHVKRSVAGNFSALFGVMEEVVALEKLTQEEKAKLRETDDHLIEALLEKKYQIEATEHPSASVVAARLEGYAKSVKNSGPSFNVQFDKFKVAYPSLTVYMSDLWPLQGSDKRPGLKQIRDSLAHGMRHKYSNQAIAVAYWHFARLAERLVFLVLGTDVPRGIHPNSSLLRREPWYERAEWQAVQSSAKRSN
ncbi:MAG: hypothetical protein PSV40_15740 [Polaromonas sp.]|uniref:hypothetical protein n=1 Tax=Polaromonas sp. TaxID=1869339 RepID=UPI002487792A|nr:hypothetical protein [Polaromonas sp.]MDI1270540.1 hypothetical protein [Polaromonas sp.]